MKNREERRVLEGAKGPRDPVPGPPNQPSPPRLLVIRSSCSGGLAPGESLRGAQLVSSGRQKPPEMRTAASPFKSRRLGVPR